MKKKIVSLMLAMAMLCSMLTTFATASTAAGMSNFKKSSTYPAGKFTDVSSTSWYADSVKEAYELGLVLGTSDTLFSPNSDLSIAQILVMACRLHSIYYTGSATFAQSSPWYQVYVDYAVKNGIITANMFSNYDAPATRAQVAIILCNSLPAEALPAINTVVDDAIGDIRYYDSWSKAVYTLYRSGIMNGVGDKHLFYSARGIKRSEIAAIVTRMANPSARVRVTMDTPSEPVIIEIPAPAPVPTPAPVENKSTNENKVAILKAYGNGLVYCSQGLERLRDGLKDISDGNYSASSPFAYLLGTLNAYRAYLKLAIGYWDEAITLCGNYTDTQVMKNYLKELVNIYTPATQYAITTTNCMEYLDYITKIDAGDVLTKITTEVVELWAKEGIKAT